MNKTGAYRDSWRKILIENIHRLDPPVLHDRLSLLFFDSLLFRITVRELYRNCLKTET